MHAPRSRTEDGFTLVELTFAFIILVICSVVLINHLAVNYKTTATERDRVFAYTKAQAILAEIQGFVDRGAVDAAVDLDVLDDGVVNKAPLTIQTNSGGTLVAADHVVSGNYQRNGEWLWSRRITVQPFVGLNNRNVRYVTVRIFKKDDAGVDRPMADLSAVINSAGSAFPTTQVFDIYLLAIENIPGWWVFMDSIKPFVESMITDLETRNPGLSFRTHWITKASFGRNQSYRPYTNDTNDSHAPIPSVYHYSGRMPAGNASTYYYVPDNIRARVNVDGVERNGFSDGPTGTNPVPYSLADFFNHGMRYPDEVALWEARVAAIEQREQEIAAALAAGTPPPPELDDMSKEPTMRILLEELYSDPDKYRNALMINLHGELLPMPALRNYSDAARDPDHNPFQRVVVHPEELRTDITVPDPLRLRVYAYHADPVYTGPDYMADPMAVEIVGVNLTDASDDKLLDSAVVQLENVRGGVVVNGNAEYDTAWNTSPAHLDDGPATGEMHYLAQWVPPSGGAEGFTRILLFNTPLRADPVTSTLDGQVYGLANSERAKLYQLPYIPSPVQKDAGGVPDFDVCDLTTPGIGPKNTARWRITIDPAVLTTSRFVRSDGSAFNPTGDVRLQVRTRIASNYTGAGGEDWERSGTMWPPAARMMPENLSVTYAWWTDSAEDVPFTERAQFNGDPRHLPYKDCFDNGDDFPNSYNWFHDALNNGGENARADFTSLNSSNLWNRWNSAMTADVPRYMELLRKGITRSAVVYTTLTGYSYYYLGIGNDIGYDAANGYPNSIPSDLTPHGSPGATGYINTIIGARRYVRATGANYWWGMPWLGELYPDDAVAMWWDTSGGSARGNLEAGNASGQFFQNTCNSVYSGSNRTAFGTTLNNFLQRTANPGCTCFFNIGTSTSSFHHTSSSGNGTLTAVGQELAQNYGMAMPNAAPITRPFGLTRNGFPGEHWSRAPYSTERYSASLYRTYYTHGAGTGSGLVKLVDPTNSSAAYVVVNGISNAVDNGTTFIAKFSMLSLVHSFFEAGSTSNTLRIPQLARLEIESPTDITELLDPTTIEVQYSVDWTRWDGVPYAQTGSYAEDEAELEYVLMYSNDGGATWYYMQDDTLATPGERPSSTYLVPDANAGVETYDWDVPSATFPQGSYLLRIDCYRQGAQVHYSFHKTKIFIQR